MMRSRPGIILQARMASTRLPGKALEPVGGHAIIHQCLRRLIASGVPALVLATTTAPEDDALVLVAARFGVPVFRGERDDVLGRFSDAAETFHLDPVIRATGDNPAVDSEGVTRVLRVLAASGADYVCETGLPVGAAVEGVSAAALHYAAATADSPYDREHVTTFIKTRRDVFHVRMPHAPAALVRPSLRLTVDTREDLDWMRELFFRTQTDNPSLTQLIAAAECARREVA